ncbi:MAG: flavin reductase family protein [Candidatus Saganbacteria bacterium]|nr:flavin reductase family protein [Candidatus Saganbacteria bacterium]
MDTSALRKLSYGMYVVCSTKDGNINGQIADTVFQVTSEPVQIAVCINKQNLTHEFISSSGIFSVSVLSQETPMIFIGKFGFKSGRDTDKFKDTKYETGTSKVPIVLDFAVASLEGKVVKSLDVGTHTLFIGEITDSRVLSDKEPMTYSYYHEYLKGKSPKTAPTYISAEELKS